MSSSRGKKTATPASKKRKGVYLTRVQQQKFVTLSYSSPLSVPEFGTALDFYTEEFKEENELHALTRHIHFCPSKCWHTLAPGAASYNPSHSKASVLPPSLRYLHTILASTITGVISIGPYVTQLARHFGLLDTVAQESSLTLIGQMSPQGISSMLSIRKIEKRRGTYPPQYIDSPNLPRRRPMRTFLMMSLHSTKTHRLSHLYPLVQFMRRLHMLTSRFR
ncbi:hypothetical protein GOBAR_AA25608 [Gossypium barbadense]|uniref:Uncharacterized protein n=1 Tax=Gossypium barbadense TaxID=3634 RepID=A0A2P5WVH5_GOSBA|nr:hypothetical protein GOBAR_AA25608 [Gossypium barbadense]